MINQYGFKIVFSQQNVVRDIIPSNEIEHLEK